MRMSKAVFTAVSVCLVPVGLTACGPSAAAKACEPYNNVCYHDMTIQQMHEEVAAVGDNITFVTYVPSVELQEEMGITNSPDKGQAYPTLPPNLAPQGWRVAGVTGTLPNPSDDDVIMYGITFKRINP